MPWFGRNPRFDSRGGGTRNVQWGGGGMANGRKVPASRPRNVPSSLVIRAHSEAPQAVSEIDLRMQAALGASGGAVLGHVRHRPPGGIATAPL